MNKRTANIRKLLPSLALGVCITLLALIGNYLVYERRLPAMAVGNRILADDDDPAPSPDVSLLRILAGLVNRSDNFVNDVMYYIRGFGDFPSTEDRIAVIAIDSASIVRHGSWPWPRRDIAMLLEKAGDARVIGLDLLFPDPDPTSLSGYVADFETLYGRKLGTGGIAPENLDNDLYLSRKIERTGTVLGAVIYDGIPPPVRPDEIKNNIAPEARLPNGNTVSDEELLLKNARWAITSRAQIRDALSSGGGEGFMNLFPGPGGSVRSVPVFAHVPSTAFSIPYGARRRVAPSVALEMMRVNLGGDGYRINLRGDRVTIPELNDFGVAEERYTVKSVSILKQGGDVLTIPLNELGEMEIGPRARRRHNDFKIYPAWKVLAGSCDGEFKDKLVVIGSTVRGLGYVSVTDLPEPEVTVAEAHATMLSSMLKGDFMDSAYQDDYAWQQLFILASGLAVTVAIILGGLLGGIVVSLLTLCAIVLCNYFLFFRWGIDVGLTIPVLSTLAVQAVLMVADYLVAGRERRFIRKAFQLNVSPSILGYLESHPDRLSSLQGEHRHMTVLFTDIRAFTTMSERMTAPDLALFLNEYFTPMSDIVMANTGTVDKFIGDGLMAFWNAPTDNPHHARDAARSALDMLAKLEELQHGWTMRGLPQVSIGCGVNTGPMFAGYMGSEQRKNYTVMGDNVNIASRLENLNKTYLSSILITESTRAELGGEFVYRVVDKVRVSGKAEALLIYELLGLGPASEEKIEELAAFSRVFELYQEREFATAESLLKELVFIRPSPLYKMYLDRLAIYKALPPPPDWDGTFAMTQK